VFIYNDIFIYVFICSLFAYTVSNREHVVLNDVIVNNELKKIWTIELSYILIEFIIMYVQTYQLCLKVWLKES
jgi:hypothetical protein